MAVSEPHSRRFLFADESVAQEDKNAVRDALMGANNNPELSSAGRSQCKQHAKVRM